MISDTVTTVKIVTSNFNTYGKKHIDALNELDVVPASNIKRAFINKKKKKKKKEKNYVLVMPLIMKKE
jgi:hypothetical protein